MAAKIRVVMKSFMSQSNQVSGLIPFTKKIGLPESRALYTVLRSPHIDKKSREQFSMHVKKQFVEQTAKPNACVYLGLSLKSKFLSRHVWIWRD